MVTPYSQFADDMGISLVGLLVCLSTRDVVVDTD